MPPGRPLVQSQQPVEWAAAGARMSGRHRSGKFECCSHADQQQAVRIGMTQALGCHGRYHTACQAMIWHDAMGVDALGCPS